MRYRLQSDHSKDASPAVMPAEMAEKYTTQIAGVHPARPPPGKWKCRPRDRAMRAVKLDKQQNATRVISIRMLRSVNGSA